MGEEEEEKKKKRWEGKVSATVKEATAEEIFPLLADFFNLQRWFPTASRGVSGENGVPGCVRLCSAFSIESSSDGESWSKERLLALDRDARSLTYELVDSNIGFHGYVSTLRVVPEAEDAAGGCVIEWVFSVDPVDGWAEDDLVAKYHAALALMARNMDDYALALGRSATL